MKILKSFAFVVSFLTVVAVNASPTLELTVTNSQRSCSGPVTGVVERTNQKGKPLLEKVKVVVKATGFNGRVNFGYHYTTEGFEVPPTQHGRDIVAIQETTAKNSIEFKFLPLRQDRLYTQTMIVVTAIDKDRNVVTASYPFVVSREAIIKKEDDMNTACVQVFQPQIRSGLIENSNDTDASITTSVGTTRITEERVSKTLGWSLVPSFFSGGTGISLFGLNGNRLKGVATMVNETEYTAVTHILNPGDVGLRYVQFTRLMEPYSIMVADGCGQFTEAVGQRLYLERQVEVHNLYKVANPYNPQAIDEIMKTQPFGREVMNSCVAIDSRRIPLPN